MAWENPPLKSAAIRETGNEPSRLKRWEGNDPLPHYPQSGRTTAWLARRVPQAFENVYVVPVQAQAHLAENVRRDSVIKHPTACWHHQYTGARTGSLVRLRDRVTVAIAAATTGDDVERLACVRCTFRKLVAALDQEECSNASTHRVCDCIVTMANASGMRRAV